MSKRAMARCAHCNSPGNVRDSEEVTVLHRDMWFICTNVECGHSWKAQLSFVHTVASPVHPNPQVNLPLSPHRHQRKRNDSRKTDPPNAASA